MGVVEIVVSILCSISFFLFWCSLITGYKKTRIVAFTVFVCMLIILVLSEFDDNPTAMDVYQGHTELKYTVINGEKVDSVVIFKKNLH